MRRSTGDVIVMLVLQTGEPSPFVVGAAVVGLLVLAGVSFVTKVAFSRNVGATDDGAASPA